VHGLGPGAYTVAWQVLSADDGHVTQGAYVLAVGDPTALAGAVPVAVTAAASPLLALGRWVSLVGLTVLLGAFVGPPGFGMGGPSRRRELAVMLGAPGLAVAGQATALWSRASASGPLRDAAAPFLETIVGRASLLQFGITGTGRFVRSRSWWWC
jgi:hypothetical protein